jgi:hypothetical protein
VRDKLQQYLDSILPLLNLKQWTIKVSKDIPSDDAWADIEVSENLWEATLRIGDDFFRETPESQRRILAHEMVHVHQAPVERLVNTLEGVLGSQAFEILDKVWDTETERSAESLSFVIAEMLPLPELKEGRKRS